MSFRVRVSNPLSHVILKKTLSPPSLGQWPPILVTCDSSRVDNKHRITWLIYHVITLYSQKCISPVSQRQWPLNLVGLWVRGKRFHLLFQVPCLSSIMHVMIHKHKATEISWIYLNIEKLINQNLFLLFKRYLNLIHIDMLQFKLCG